MMYGRKRPAAACKDIIDAILLLLRSGYQSLLVGNLDSVGDIANFSLLRDQDTYLCEVLDISYGRVRGNFCEFCPTLGSELALVFVQKNVEDSALTLIDIGLGMILPKDRLVQNGR